MDKLLQAMVLRTLLTRKGWDEYSDIVTPEIIANATAVALYGFIQRLHERGAADITPDMLKVEITSTFRKGEGRANELCDLVDAVAEAPEVVNDDRRNAVTNYAKRELLNMAAKFIATNLSEPELDENIPLALCERASEIGAKIDAKVLDFADASLPGQADDRPALCGLGISRKLDSVLDGGTAGGELCLYLAPSSRGKTSYLIATGASAAQEGKSVLHVTLEISEERVIRRYDQAFTHLKRHEMIDAPKLVALKRKEIVAKGGRLMIMDWSHKEPCPHDIYGLVKRLRSQGKRVDVLIVDSLGPDLMSANPRVSKSRRDLRHDYSQLARDMRATSVQLGIPVFSGWQTNDLGAQENYIKRHHMAEAKSVFWHADTVIAFDQSPEELRGNMMNLSVLKQREDEERPRIPIHSNMKRMIIGDKADCPIEEPRKLLEVGNDHSSTDPDTNNTDDSAAKSGAS